MGNQLAQPQKLQPEILAELPNVVLKDNLGGGRFLKTLLCVHDDGGLVVVKVYYKRGDALDLRPYEQQLADIRNRISGVPFCHIWPFQRFFHSDKAAYLVRQYIFANLYHRLSTRPFLSRIEKQWIAFQLLLGVQQMHERGVCHGDIKCENVLVTSWEWVYISDFASYKPVYLPADNPADFSFFFDTGGRRRCYVAPERFYEAGSSEWSVNGDGLQPAMDIFSMGCVLAELFMEGTALFDLSTLLAYRTGQYDPAPTLSKLDPPMRDLVLHMIQLKPDARLSAAEYLRQWGPCLFPPYFDSVLHPFLRSILHMDADTRVAAVRESFSALQERMAAACSHAPMPKMTDTDIEALVSRGAAIREAGRTMEVTSTSSRSGLYLSDTPPGGSFSNGIDLLDDVGALLTDTYRFAERVQDSEDGGLFLEPQSDGRPRAAPQAPGSSAVDVAAVTLTGAADAGEQGDAAEEVQVDEAWECQVTDGTGVWREHKENALRGREDVELPSKGGWQWLGGWVLDSQEGDTEGWLHRSTAIMQAEGSNPGSTPSSTDPSDVTRCRQRKWTRQRHRKLPLKQQAASATPLPSDTTPDTSPTREGGSRAVSKSPGGPEEGTTLIAVLLCSVLRGAKLPENKIQAVLLLSDIARWCDDDVRLQRIIPYVLALIGDSSASVRWTALRCVAKVMAWVEQLPPSDKKIFNEYILPSLSLVPNDHEESVRIEYTAVIAKLAAAAYRFLQVDGEGGGELSDQLSQSPGGVDECVLPMVRGTVEKMIHELVVGSRSSSYTRQSCLPHAGTLAHFLGQRECNNFLLPALITFLNDTDWRLRAAFYSNVEFVAQYTGPTALEVVLLPCIERAMEFQEPPVVANAVHCLAHITQAGLLRKQALLTAASFLLPKLLLSNCPAVRAAAVDFVTVVARRLSLSDCYARLWPLVEPAMLEEPQTLTSQQAIIDCLKAPAVPSTPPTPACKAPAHMYRSGSVDSVASQSTRPRSAASQQLHMTRSPSPRVSTSSSYPNELASTGSRAGLGVNDAAGRQASGWHESNPTTPSAALYVLDIDSQQLVNGQSRLSAALDSAYAGNQDVDGHLIAPRETSSSPPKPSTALGMHTTEITQKLVCCATRHVPHTTGDLPSTSHLAATLTRSIDDDDMGLRSISDVSDAMAAAITTGLPSQPSAPSFDITPWQPSGVLIAHMAEHKNVVNQLAVAQNGAFFVSASNDETVKVWDCRRLERDVSFRSRLTYAGQGGPILAVTSCEDSQSVASVSANGSLHVWRVEYTCRAGGAPDRYSGIISRVQVQPEEGAILDVLQWGSLLLYCTQRGGVHARDLRINADVWSLAQPASQGMLTQLAPDPVSCNWLVTGSSRGNINVWDTRFQLSVNSWQLPQQMPVDALSPALAPPARLGIRGPLVQSPMVYVACGGNEVGLWDVEQGKCHQVLRVIPPMELEAVRKQPPLSLTPGSSFVGGSPLDAATLDHHLAVQQLQVPQPRPAGCRTLLVTGAGPVLTAGSDRCIRLWDSLHPEMSYVVCGPTTCSATGGRGADPASGGGGGDRVVAYQYTSRYVGDVPVIQECSMLSSSEIKEGERPVNGVTSYASSLVHHDAITHMTHVDISDRILLSCSRDGVIKAWR